MNKKFNLLVGPFIGELFWEYYHFAPYLIYLKNNNPKINMIVCTREERFDFYGKYANILIPIKIKNDIKNNQTCFTIRDYDIQHYNNFVKSYYDKYNKEFKINEHIYPDISNFYWKFKWQFPRKMMNYNFKTRIQNKKIAKQYIKSSDIILNIPGEYYFANTPNIDILFSTFNMLVNYNTSSLWGCIIESIKICKGIIGKIDDDIIKVALLLKKPIVLIDEKISYDKINLLNVHKIPIMHTLNIEEGIYYLDNL